MVHNVWFALKIGFSIALHYFLRSNLLFTVTLFRPHTALSCFPGSFRKRDVLAPYCTFSFSLLCTAITFTAFAIFRLAVLSFHRVITAAATVGFQHRSVRSLPNSANFTALIILTGWVSVIVSFSSSALQAILIIVRPRVCFTIFLHYWGSTHQR